MKTLPLSLVEDAWDEINDNDPATMRELLDCFRLEQPVLSGFLLAAEDDLLVQADHGQLILLGFWIWLAFQKAGGAKHEISAKMVEAAFDTNYRQLTELEHATSGNVMDQAADWTQAYRQMPLLGALIEYLMSGNLEDVGQVDDRLGVLTLYLKTAIDCLDQ